MQKKQDYSDLDDNMLSSDKHSEDDNGRLSINSKECRLDKAKKILKKNWIALLAIAISILALLQSGINIYYTHIHKSHDFKCLVLDYMATSDGIRSSQVVLINEGTYTETLCNARFIYSDKKDFGEKDKDYVCELGKSKQGAISLKPGDRSICLIEDKTEPWMLPYFIDGGIEKKSKEEALSWFENKNKLPYLIHCGVLFEVIGKSGKMHKTWIYIGNATYYPSFFIWPLTEVNVIVNLLKPNFKHRPTVSRRER
jgi:hypothetical protein